jgi:hypothetical protein
MSIVFNIAKQRLMNGLLDLDSDTIKVSLANNTYTAPSDAAFADYDTLAAIYTGTILQEATGTGYTGGAGGSGRKTLASVSVDVDDANNRSVFKAADVLWDDGPGISAGTIQGALVYEHGSGSDDSLNIPICWVNTGGFPIVTNGGSLKIKWAENASGIGVVIILS